MPREKPCHRRNIGLTGLGELIFYLTVDNHHDREPTSVSKPKREGHAKSLEQALNKP